MFSGPYGHLDMGGGVRQWVGDWKDPGYYAASPYRNPMGPRVSTESSKMERGAGYEAGSPLDLEIWHSFSHDIFGATRVTGCRGARDL